MSAKRVLGIDIGGSGIKGAVVDVSRGRLITSRIRFVTPSPARPAAVVRAIKKVVAHFSWRGPVGVGFPGIVRNQVAYSAHNLHPAWIGCDLAQRFRAASGCPVFAMNDADVAAVGELAFGAGRRGRGTVLVLTFGTGIGSALFRDGELIPNLELGHLQFKDGIAEDYCAASVREEKNLSWKAWGKRVNAYLHHLDRLVSPDLIIVGGGVSRKFDKFSPNLDLEVDVVPAKLRNEAGIIGAATAAGRLLPRGQLKVRSFVAPEED
jgi:polyphosphate glucokinase